MQVERISNEIFIEFNHELVTFKRAKPLNPRNHAAIGTALIRELTFNIVLFLVTVAVVILLLLLLLGSSCLLLSGLLLLLH